MDVKEREEENRKIEIVRKKKKNKKICIWGGIKSSGNFICQGNINILFMLSEVSSSRKSQAFTLAVPASSLMFQVLLT